MPTWRFAVLLALLLGGCGTVQWGPRERLVTTAEANAYCRVRVRPSDLGPVMHGCWIDRENLIVADSAAVLYHERKHVEGWDHKGACHSDDAHRDGLTLDGKPCVWFRKFAP